MSHWYWFIYDHRKDVTAVESIPEDEEVEQTEVQTSEEIEKKVEDVEQTEEKTEDTKPEDKNPEDKTEEEKKEEDEFNIKGLPKLVIVGLGHVLP